MLLSDPKLICFLLCSDSSQVATLCCKKSIYFLYADIFYVLSATTWLSLIISDENVENISSCYLSFSSNYRIVLASLWLRSIYFFNYR